MNGRGASIYTQDSRLEPTMSLHKDSPAISLKIVHMASDFEVQSRQKIT